MKTPKLLGTWERNFVYIAFEMRSNLFNTFRQGVEPFQITVRVQV